jgi:hypothetical protein
MDLLNLSKLADKSSKSLARIHLRDCVDVQGELGGGVNSSIRHSGIWSCIHRKNHIHIRVLREDVGCSVGVKVLVETVSTKRTTSAIRLRALEVSTIEPEIPCHAIQQCEAISRHLHAWNSGHTGLVPRDYFDPPRMAPGEELAGWRYEEGRDPTVRTSDVGGFRIVASVARMTPLPNALCGGVEVRYWNNSHDCCGGVIRTCTQRT